MVKYYYKIRDDLIWYQKNKQKEEKESKDIYRTELTI